MYQTRVTAFIDILGFRNIIYKTENNQELTEKIFTVLNTMNSENISNEIFIEMTPDIPKEELESVKEITNLFSQALKGQSSIQVTHFSDSIVISVGMENDMNVMSVFEYIGRLIYKLWNEFKILIRGAITTGQLVHNENGGLFGPAMVLAYDYETNLANYPRIIIDEYTSRCIKTSEIFKNMSNLFIDINIEKKIKDKVLKIENGLEINIVSSLNHFLNNQFAFNEAKRLEMQYVKDNLIAELNNLKKETERPEIQEKYDYLIELIEEK